MSPHLRDYVAKPCPAYVPGDRVWFPGEMGFSTVIDVKWVGQNWSYIFDTDMADLAEITALEATRREAA